MGTTLIIVAILAVVSVVSFYFFTQMQSNSFQQNKPQSSQQTTGFQQQTQTTGFSTLPSCGSNNTLFSVSPVNPTDIVTLAPLGQMTPPDHVFPAPHNYIYVLDVRNPQDKEVNVYAMGDMTLTQIEIRHYNTIGQRTNYTDYTLLFQPCSDFYLYFHHIKSLKYQPFIDATQKLIQTCSFSTTRNEDICNSNENIAVKAGTLIGTTGDLKSGTYGLDVGARDYRVPYGKNFTNPDRFCSQGNFFDRCHTVCAFDYLPANISSQLVFSGFDGTVRTANPACGTVYDDIPNSAQGYWSIKGQQQQTFSPESDNIFLGPDNINPSVKLFSIGNRISNVSPGRYTFAITNSGFVNRDFKDVAVGNVYCYDLYQSNGPILASNTDQPTISMIIQLIDASTLRAERLSSGGCGSGPWIFDSNYADFVR